MAPPRELAGAISVSLEEYQRKRDFKRTPEPKGQRPRSEPTRRYVVHRHHATRLHWDVRLEMRGILASWAVPQGPPLEGGKRRLAVHTEDHPIEYLDFSGVIRRATCSTARRSTPRRTRSPRRTPAATRRSSTARSSRSTSAARRRSSGSSRGCTCVTSRRCASCDARRP